MSNELELIDYINIIYLKNQLVCLPVEKLLEKYQKEDMYGLFLDTVSLMIEHDRGFFLFCPDGISKVEDIIQKYRFLYPDSDLLSKFYSFFYYDKRYHKRELFRLAF